MDPTITNPMNIVANCIFFVCGLFFFLRQKYLIAIICFIAFANYSAINCNIGKTISYTETNHDDEQKETKKEQEQPIIDYLPRYLDWIITTPLLVLSLIHQSELKDTKIIFFLLVCDVLMIYTGYLATLTNDPTLKLIMYFISCFFMFYIFITILRYNPPRLLISYFILIWLGYPIFWILHQTKAGINNDVYNYLIASLDIIAKAGFGFLLLSYQKPF